MTAATTLLALATRAEAGGDDALSDDCWRALGWREITARNNDGPPYFAGGWQNAERGYVPGPRPDLRDSLDAVEEVPGRIVKVQWLPQHNRWGAETEAVTQFPDICLVSIAPTEILARLAAKLRALAHKESNHG